MKSLHQAGSRSENQPQKLLHTPFFQVISHSSVLETLTLFHVEVVSSLWQVFSIKVNAEIYSEITK